jgi:uncharacterized membrane protein YoaK (UPF0700 family)
VASTSRRAKALAAPEAEPARRIWTRETRSLRGHIVCDNLGLASLSLGCGCTDVLSFLELGNLFTSAMTGNTALLAVAICSGQLFAASLSLTALLGFGLGVALATAIEAAWPVLPPDPRRGLSRLLLVELFFLVGCAALWSASPRPILGGDLYTVILLSALSMGIQAVGARIINASGINTIVFTSVLVRIVMSVTDALVRRASGSASLAGIGPHLGTFAAYGCGALLAGALVAQHLAALIWVPVAAVVLALGLAELSRKLERRTR